MGQKIGIQMIDMYVKMIREEFEPLMAALNVREMAIREQVEEQVKRKFGIYDLMMKREHLKLQLTEMTNKLSDWERRQTIDGKYTTKIEYAVESEMEKMRNGLGKQIGEAKKAAIKSVRLMGTSEDVVGIFKDISKQIADMGDQLKALPAPEKTVPRISRRKGTKAK